VIPSLLASAVGLTLMLALVFRRPLQFSVIPFSTEALLVALWTVTPPGILLALALFTNLQLFTDRYFLDNAPGVALAAGMLLCRLDPAAMRRFVATTLTVLAVLLYGVTEHFTRGADDFRGAVAAVRQQTGDSPTPVIVVTTFIEGRYLSDVLDPSMSEVLFSPVLRYRIPGELVVAPMVLNQETEAYMEHVVTTKLQHQHRFLLVGLFTSAGYRSWLERRCRSLGFTDRLDGTYGNLRVYLFERSP
jgi:hypothetical protein